MSRDSLYIVGAEAALALVARFFEEPFRVGDARMFAAGRVHLWDRWKTLTDAERQLVARYLRWRPVALAEDVVLRKRMRMALDRGVRFQWQNKVEDDDFASTFEVSSGKCIDQVLEELLRKLEADRGGGSASVERVGDAVQLRAQKQAYTVPLADIPDSAGAVAVTATEPASVQFDRTRLLKLASALDRRKVDGVPQEKVLSALFKELRGGTGDVLPEQIELPAGPTQLFVAPTGRGKSVLARLMAIDAASQGIPVAYVVPDIKTTLSEAKRIESYANALEMPLRVAPVNGLSQMFDRVVDALERPPADDPGGAWTLQRLGYSCRLAAYADDTPARAGWEPCGKLHQVVGERKRAVACPFAASCPKFDTYRDAASAEILVVNHSAFIRGLMPLDVETADGIRRRMPVLELVLRRAGLILIDEVDQLQGKVIEGGTGSLQLTSRHTVSPLHELFEDVERKKAAGDLPADVTLEHLRKPMFEVRWLSEELADQINRGDVKWPPRDKLRMSRGRDSELARKLFGAGEQAHDRLDAVFGDEQIEDIDDERLRLVVRQWTNRRLDEASDTQALRAELVQVLGAWPRSFGKSAERAAKSLASVADALILRAMLARLEQAVNHLRAHLPMLDEHGIKSASTVRDALLGYSSWSPSPLGPLGRRPMGFSFHRNAGEPGVLTVQALAGDPHGYVAGLGDEIAAALSGSRRVVLGISATARFPGSPRADVQAPVAFAQPDTGRGAITVEAVPVADDDGSGPVRVSGVSAIRGRSARVARLGSLLWDQVLRDHLADLASDPSTKARARSLLVTGSYVEAQAVATGVAYAMGNASEASRRIRFLSRTSNGNDHPPALLARDLEGFGATGADILVAPLQVVARGHNILAPNTDHSAIASIFVLVRPVPPAEHPEAALAHLSYDARRRGARSARPSDAIDAERRRAEQQLRFLQQSAGPFSHLPADLRHQVLCDVLVDIAQLAGRARRGDTDVRLYLVDGAFHDEQVGWAPLLAQSFETWKAEKRLDEITWLHGSFIEALQRFAGIGVSA